MSFNLSFFSSNDTIKLLNTSQGISLEESKKIFFLPYQFCSSVSYVMRYPGLQDTGSDIQQHIRSYHKNVAKFSYGGQVFRVIPNEGLGSLQVEVYGGNPIPIHQRLK